MNLGPGLLPAAARPDIFAKGIILVQRRTGKKTRRRHHSRRITPGHQDDTDDEGPKYHRKYEDSPESTATAAKKSNQEEGSPGRPAKAGQAAGPSMTIDGLELSAHNTAWSPDGKKVATEVLEKKIVLLDVTTGRRMGVWDANQTTLQDAVMTGHVTEEQRVQDIEDVDLMRRHLMTAKDRADEAEKELKRVRLQLREMREANDEANERIAALEEEGAKLKKGLEAAEKQVTKSLERLSVSEHSCKEGERREKNLGARVKELEDRIERMDIQHTAEVRQLRQELDIARLKVEVEQTRQDVRRLEGLQEKGGALAGFSKMFSGGGGGGGSTSAAGASASSPLAAASSSLATTLKSLTGLGGGSTSPAGGRPDGTISPVAEGTEGEPRKQLARVGTMSALSKTLKSAATTASECKQS